MRPVYDDQLPVEDGWSDEHRGEIWTFRMVIGLSELMCGIDEVNDICDERIGVTLSGLSFAVGQPDPEDRLDGQHLLLEVTGEVED